MWLLPDAVQVHKAGVNCISNNVLVVNFEDFEDFEPAAVETVQGLGTGKKYMTGSMRHLYTQFCPTSFQGRAGTRLVWSDVTTDCLQSDLRSCSDWTGVVRLIKLTTPNRVGGAVVIF